MKKIIILFAILFTSIGFAQGKNIHIEYGLVIQNEPELYKTNALLRSSFENAMRDSHKMTFELIITKDGSKFFDKKKLETDINYGSNSFALAISSYSGVVYELKDRLFVQHPILGQNVYEESDLKSNWVLTNETKLIDNYLCYKATNIYKVTNDIKTFLHPVIAWYCPQIPYRYGPNGYSNLPGLILELQVRNVVFGAKVIKLDSELDFDLKFLDKIKILRGKEVDDAYEKFNGF
ncbi:GLPGLI family protein [Flavobacterium sp.]|jgi:GLPGLI family protein|uniref:GLPGLI family protein n=1 Tax=Flavobacterium sp. TaxID=239 RepID=UPI0037BEA197